jgi:hypothetical protein
MLDLTGARGQLLVSSFSAFSTVSVKTCPTVQRSYVSFRQVRTLFRERSSVGQVRRSAFRGLGKRKCPTLLRPSLS